jgi:hypothetical protein
MALCPRIQKNPDKIIWENPHHPEYDVVSVTPLSHYETPLYSESEVSISKNYLEDYASLKGCAVAAVYYEERKCLLDDELNNTLLMKMPLNWISLDENLLFFEMNIIKKHLYSAVFGVVTIS